MRLNVIIFSILTVCFILNAGNISPSLEKLLELNGKRYEKTRDIILKNGELSFNKNISPRELLLLEILKARKKHPEIFKKLPIVIEKGYYAYQKQMKIFGDCPGKFITKNALQFSSQGGIEKKVYIKVDVTEESAPYAAEVKHIQTDAQVAKAKDINSAARLAVIEYLWKLTKRPRVIYELLEAFVYPINPISSQQYLPALEDVFKNINGFMSIETSVKIFIKSKYKKIIPTAKNKLQECLKKKDYKSAYAILRLLKELKIDNYNTLERKLLPELKKMKKSATK